MEIGLSASDIDTLLNDELLANGRYTVSEPGGKLILTSEQRLAITRAFSRVLAANNDAILNQLRQAGVSGI